jgi:hypothetical protein
MPLVPIPLPPGVVRSSTAAMSRGRYWDANLVRWRGRHMLPVGGWERISKAPLPSPARRILSWRDLDDIRRTAYLCDRNIVVQEGNTYTDHTPDDFVGDDGVPTTGGFGIGPYGDDTFGTPRAVGDQRLYLRPPTWSLDTFGEDLMLLASSDGRLMRLSPGGTPTTRTEPGASPKALPPKAEVVAEAPVANRAMVVTEERHVMLFGAGGNPRRVAWCSREDYNNWDFSSTTNTAGFFDLDIGGWIVNAVKVRGGVLIFTDSEVWLCRYRGVPFVYGFERIGSSCSLLAPHAFAVSAGVSMWMGHEGFWTYDGGSVRPMACDVEDFVYDALDPSAAMIRPFAAANGAYAEMWFFYPSKGNTECDRYVIWSYDPTGPWWSIGALGRTAASPSGVYPYPLMTNPQGHVFQHESGWKDGETGALVRNVFAETGALSIPATGDRFVHVVQGQLDSSYGAQRTEVRAFLRDTHDGPETAVGPFVPREDGYLDARFSGRDIRLRYTALQDGDWTIGEPRFDVRQGGKR